MASLLESDMADKTVSEVGSFSQIIASYLSLVMARAGVFAMLLLSDPLFYSVIGPAL